MALKKTICSRQKPDGTWIPQQDIDMHPLEEAHCKSEWALNKLIKSLPPVPTKQQEHEWLIEHGTDFVKQKRAEWQAAHDNMKPRIDAAHAAYQAAHHAWCNHADHCVRNNIDPDKH